MDRFTHHRNRCLLGLVYGVIAVVANGGCSPVQPYFYNEDGDLSHLIDTATDISYPIVEQPTSKEALGSIKPFTVADAKITNFADMTLERTIATALQNSHIIQSIGISRRGGGIGRSNVVIADDVTANPDFAQTIYDPAIQETSSQGVEAALSAFDAELSTSLFWEKTDRPQNVTPDNFFDTIFARHLQEDNANFRSEIAKRAATGTQYFLRNITNYQLSNNPSRFLPSDWFTSIEAELRHPLMRGGGTAINRIPVILARIRNDVEIADFELAVTNQLSDVEQAYWSLYFAYLNFDVAKKGRDSAQTTYQRVKVLFEGGMVNLEEEAQAREQFQQFKALMEENFLQLLQFEGQLRNLIGWAASDGRMIRPIDVPTDAKVEFDYELIKSEALAHRAEIRRQRWRIKEREMELSLAKNQMLPQLDATLLYRFLGQGDKLLGSNRRGINFPGEGSTAFDNLTENQSGEWRIGLDFETRIGNRQEMAQVQNAKLRLTRERKVLEKIEDQVVHQVDAAFRNVESHHTTVQTRLYARIASNDNVRAAQASFEADQVAIDLLLQAQRREAQATIDYYRTLLDYNIAIVEVHFRKGSLLEHNSVLLSEGPWPAKAYFDAIRRARQRDASYFLDYGYTRPRVISKGPAKQIDPAAILELSAPVSQQTFQPQASDVLPETTPDSSDAVELLPTDVITPDDVTEAAPSVTVPSLEPTVDAGLSSPSPATLPSGPDLPEPADDQYDWGSTFD